MAKAFAEGRRVLTDDGVGSVVFAHKTTEGWEALLAGMIRGGWTVTGSWPIATEMASRLRARDSAALATSVHLICRPRPEDAPIGDWADVLGELPRRVADWMERLQGEGIRGADLVFACIGPALEIFSRYRGVETADGHTVGLPEYLEKVWEVVGRAALQQVLGAAESQARNGLSGALEEDARLTALFLWTLQSNDTVAEPREQSEGTGETDAEAAPKATATGFSLPFDVVRRFAQPMGIDLDTWSGRIIGQERASCACCRWPSVPGNFWGTTTLPARSTISKQTHGLVRNGRSSPTGGTAGTRLPGSRRRDTTQPPTGPPRRPSATPPSIAFTPPCSFRHPAAVRRSGFC